MRECVCKRERERERERDVGGCRGRAMDVGVMVCVGALNMRPSACARACVWVVLHLPGRRERDRCVCVGVCVCVCE